MKTRTLPAVSDELVIPKPAPGENVYPIYSQGVICGYVYSGGKEKKPKIFLTEDQATPTDEKPTNSKDTEWKSGEKTAAKGAATQPVNPKPKTAQSTEKIPVLQKAFRIEPKVLIANPSDKFDLPRSPTNGNTNEMQPRLPASPARKNVLQIKNPSSLIAKQNANPEPPVVMTSTSLSSSSSSNVATFANKMATFSNSAPGAKDTFILPRPLTTNYNQPVILTSGNSALPPTNWLNSPFQSNLSNTMTYFIMPTGTLGQLYLTNPANTLSTVLPTISTTSRTPTVSTVNPSAVRLSTTTTNSTATPPVTMTAARVTTSNNSNQLRPTLPRKAIVPKSTYVQLPPPQPPTSSSPNKETNDDSDETQPNASQLKMTNLENENGASETESSRIHSIARSEKASKESASFGNDTPSNEADRPAVELAKTTQEKMIDLNLTSSFNTEGSFISKENENLYYKFSLNKDKYGLVKPIEKRPRGRPKKPVPVTRVIQKKIPIPILPATQKNFEIGSLVKFSLNDPSQNTAEPQSSKHQAGNPLPVQPSPFILVRNGEKVSKDSTSCGSDTQRKEADKPVEELTKDVEEITNNSNLNAKLDRTKKLKAYSEKAVFIPKEKKNPNDQSEMNKIKTDLVVPMMKRYKNRHREAVIIPEIDPSTLREFNLLPSRNYISSQKEGDESVSSEGNQSKDGKAKLSEYETKKRLTCDKKNGIEKQTMERKPSLCQDKEMPRLTRQDGISIKTKPFDYDSGDNREEWFDNCTTSALSFAAVPPKLPKEEESDDESIEIKDDENQLVISSSFSLSSHRGLHRKFISIDSMNSDLDDLFFLPEKADSSQESLDVESDIQGENSTNVAMGIKLKECSVRLEPLSFPAYSPSRSSSCTKPAENGNASPGGDDTNIRTLDSVLRSIKNESSLEALAKTILHQGCLKKLKENYESVKPTESSVHVSSLIATGIKRSLDTPAESILDRERLKKLKENHESIDTSSDSSSPLPSTGMKKSPEMPAKSTWHLEHSEKMKENYKSVNTTESSVHVSPLIATGTKRTLEAPAESILDQGLLKKLKENYEPVDTTLKSSTNVPALPTTEPKKSLAVPAKSILDQGQLKRLKDSHESVDLTLDSFSALPSTGTKKSLEMPARSSWHLEHSEKLKENYKSGDTLDSFVNVLTGTKKSLEVPAKSILDPERSKKFKDNYKPVDTTLKSANVSALPSTGTKNSLEVPANSNLDPEHLKIFKPKNEPIDETEIPALPKDIKESSVRSKFETVSKDVMLIPDLIDNSSNISNKSLGALPSNGDSMVIDLTVEDSFIEGCIAFHEQQLYMLQLQMDQHKLALGKLKQQQNYRKGSG